MTVAIAKNVKGDASLPRGCSGGERGIRTLGKAQHPTLA
jgi:hypothetical protein